MLLRLGLRASFFGLICNRFLFVSSPPVNEEFSYSVLLTNVPRPTAIRFSPSETPPQLGAPPRSRPARRAFVATKGGKVFSLPDIAEPDVGFKLVADLSPRVFDNFDRGMLGFALHPKFPDTPHAFAYFSADCRIGSASCEAIHGDVCPNPPCEGSGRIERLVWSTEYESFQDQTTLVFHDLCVFSATHHTGDLWFGSDESLYATSGDSSFYEFVDVGQTNTCPLSDPGDPRSGGAMRSQYPNMYEGKLFRFTPQALAQIDEGALPQPVVVATGLRNPYRFTVEQGTGDLYIADVGFADWEEVNHVPNPTSNTASGVPNFGWPCLEGPDAVPGFQAEGLPICDDIYSGARPVDDAVFQYQHGVQIGDTILPPSQQSAITAVAVYDGQNFPERYQGGLVFADYGLNGVWIVPRANGIVGGNGLDAEMLLINEPNVVDVQTGPDGSLYVCQVFRGTVSKLEFFGPDVPPIVEINTRSALQGPLPLRLMLDGGRSRDPLGGDITLAWDLDGDGNFNDGNSIQVERIYEGTRRQMTVSLQATNSKGITQVASIQVSPGYFLDVRIQTTIQSGSWRSGDRIGYRAIATDQDGVDIPQENFSWAISMFHCYPPRCEFGEVTDCHEHRLEDVVGASEGSIVAPEHEYPSFLIFEAIVRHPEVDIYHASRAELQPKTVQLELTSEPPGLELVVLLMKETTPFRLQVIEQGSLSFDTLAEQSLTNEEGITTTYRFQRWSVGDTKSQNIRVTPGTPQTITAFFEPFQIGLLAGGLLPAPTNVVVTANAYKEVTFTWQPPVTWQEIRHYFVHFRSIPALGPIPDTPFTKRLVNGSQRTLTIANVWEGQVYQAKVSAVVSQGEGDESEPAQGRTMLNPVAGVTLDTCSSACVIRSVLLDDFEDEQRFGINQNAFNFFAFDDETLGRREILNGRLLLLANDRLAYYYTLLADPTTCNDLTRFSHLQFTVDLPAGGDFSMHLGAKDARCAEQVPNSADIQLRDYLTEEQRYQAFGRTVATVKIPLVHFDGIPLQGATAFIIQNMTPNQLFYIDNIQLLQLCQVLPGQSTACEQRIVDDFQSPNRYFEAQNYMGGSTNDNQSMLSIAITPGRQLLFQADPEQTSFWYTLLNVNDQCFDASGYEALVIELAATAGASFDLVIQTSDAFCQRQEDQVRFDTGVLGAHFTGVDGGTRDLHITLPRLQEAGTDVSRLWGIVLDSFKPQDATIRLDNIRWVRSLKDCARDLKDPFNPPFDEGPSPGPSGAFKVSTSRQVAVFLIFACMQALLNG